MKKIKITKAAFTCDGLFPGLHMRRTPDGWLTNGHWAVGNTYATLPKAKWATPEDMSAERTMAASYDMLGPIEDLFKIDGVCSRCDAKVYTFKSTMRNLVIDVFASYVEYLLPDRNALFAVRGYVKEGRVLGALISLDVPVVIMGIR